MPFNAMRLHQLFVQHDERWYVPSGLIYELHVDPNVFHSQPLDFDKDQDPIHVISQIFVGARNDFDFDISEKQGLRQCHKSRIAYAVHIEPHGGDS